MVLGKDKCTICGEFKDIKAKVQETLYCKSCYDAELLSMLDEFNKIKFRCLKCGSENVRKDDARTAIREDGLNINQSLTDIIISMSAVAIITCNDCKRKFRVNMLDHG